MPKKANELTAIQVQRLTETGHHSVGGVAGLALQVTPSGARSWILRTMVGGKRRDIGLGGYPDVTLGKARERAREARDQIARGIDPVAERQVLRGALVAQQAKAMTFEQAARHVIAKKQVESRSPKHSRQWATTLQTYAYPVLGALPVSAIELAHVLAVLEPIWQEKTETATRVRQRIETVLAWATVHGHRSGSNPAAWGNCLDAILPAPAKITRVQRHRALPIDAIPAFWVQLQAREGMAAQALAFTVLTAARSGETRGATWQEIDLDALVWTVPATRMKAAREHRVPLSEQAVALLERLPRRGDTDLIFPAPRGGQLSDAALSGLLKRMGVNATVHGFRSGFRDWAAERTSTPNAIAEMALAHTVKGVEAAYRRGDLLAKRAALMQQWARFLDTPAAAGRVVGIRGQGAAL